MVWVFCIISLNENMFFFISFWSMEMFPFFVWSMVIIQQALIQVGQSAYTSYNIVNLFIFYLTKCRRTPTIRTLVMWIANYLDRFEHDKFRCHQNLSTTYLSI